MHHVQAARDKVGTMLEGKKEKIADMDKVHYALLNADPDGMVVFKKEVERTVEELFLTVKAIRAKKGDEIFSIHEVLSHLSHDRKELIRTSLRNQTFVMSIVKTGESQKVKITKGGKKYMSSIDLPSMEANGLQTASVVIEAVALMLNLIGIDVPDDQQVLDKAIKIAEKAMEESPDIITRVEQMKNAYDKDDNLGKAKAILGLAFDLFGTGVFMQIAGALLSEMHWYDWILTSAKITAFLIATIATDGLADLADLVYILLDATAFMIKLANLNAFN